MGPAAFRGRAAVPAAGALCALLGLLWGATLAPAQAWGWDETMHAQLPAVRLLLHAGRGEGRAFFEVLHGCAQYPFGWPLALAAGQGVFGIGERVARLLGVAAWAATLWVLFLCGRELGRLQRGPVGAPARGESPLPWLALGAAALSPLPLSYAGTLFLEVPFVCAASVALWTALRRLAPEAGPARDLAAGAALLGACFVKWNYGLLLAAGLGFSALVETLLAARRGEGRRAAIRLGIWLLVPLLGALWWFALPLPLGAEVAERHRAALFGFLGGNLGQPATPYAWRALHAIGWFAPSARFLALLLVGVLLTLGLGGARELRRPGARTLWVALLALAVPILAHPFHLDRFLIPIGPPLWLLAALGGARVLPVAPVRRAGVLGALLALAWFRPTFETRLLAEATVVAERPPEARAELRAHVAREFERWARLGPGRPTPSPGLPVEAHRALAELVARAVGDAPRVGWIGISSEFSPAALHLELLARGGSPERFLDAWERPLYVTFEATDPDWDGPRLARWAGDFDVVLMSDPPDLRGRRAREFMRRYQEQLVQELGWTIERIGVLSLEQPLSAPREVTLYAARPRP